MKTVLKTAVLLIGIAAPALAAAAPASTPAFAPGEPRMDGAPMTLIVVTDMARLTPTEAADVKALMPGADLSHLTQDQVIALEGALYSGSDSSQRQAVRQILH